MIDGEGSLNEKVFEDFYLFFLIISYKPSVDCGIIDYNMIYYPHQLLQHDDDVGPKSSNTSHKTLRSLSSLPPNAYPLKPISVLYET